jgi:hypothetical protein
MGAMQRPHFAGLADGLPLRVNLDHGELSAGI